MNPTAPDRIGQDRREAKLRLTRRRFIAGGAGLLGLSGSATAAYAGAVEPMSVVVTRDAVAPPRWPAGQKLTVTVIADLHAGGPDMTLTHVRQVVDVAQNLRSDLVVLLGDFKAWYGHFKTNPSTMQRGLPNWRGLRRRSEPGQSSAITIGGMTLKACVACWPRCASH